MNNYDCIGKKIGHSNPGIFGGVSNFDEWKSLWKSQVWFIIGTGNVKVGVKACGKQRFDWESWKVHR